MTFAHLPPRAPTNTGSIFPHTAHPNADTGARDFRLAAPTRSNCVDDLRRDLCVGPGVDGQRWQRHQKVGGAIHQFACRSADDLTDVLTEACVGREAQLIARRNWWK